MRGTRLRGRRAETGSIQMLDATLLMRYLGGLDLLFLREHEKDKIPKIFRLLQHKQSLGTLIS